MAALSLARLSSRKILRVAGPDCYSYMQGLITNDLRGLYQEDIIPKREHALSSRNAISTFMLNARGRVICDLMIYRTPATLDKCQYYAPGEAKDNDEILVECDAHLAEGIARTLFGYRVLRKITVTQTDTNVWCLFPNLKGEHIKASDSTDLMPVNDFSEVISDVHTVVRDPRLTLMGLRILSSESDHDAIRQSLGRVINSDIAHTHLRMYQQHRYTLGVGEGNAEHPECACLPSECNGDLLGQISFTKGCYLGQEVTSRIHHTSIVRKRLMPIELEPETRRIDKPPVMMSGSDIVSGERKIGQIRTYSGNRGIALLRLDHAIDNPDLRHNDTEIKLKANVPYWWPPKVGKVDQFAN